MTHEAQRQALAKWAGWTVYQTLDESEHKVEMWTSPDGVSGVQLPDATTLLQWVMNRNPSMERVIMAQGTDAKRVEALVKALGLWVD